LDPKIADGALITSTVINLGLNEKLRIGITPSVTDGQAIITIGGVPTWSTNFQAENLYTTGIYYAGSTVTNGEAAGSVVAVQTGSSALRGIISAQHSTDTNGAFFVGMKNRGTRAAPTVVANGDGVMRLVSAGYDGAAYIQSATLSGEVDGVVAIGSVPQALVFRTGTSGAPTERLRLSSSGTYPTKVTGAMSISTQLGMGATPALVGTIRLSNGSSCTARNALNTADLNVFSATAGNAIFIGDDAQVLQVQLRAKTDVIVDINTVSQFTINTTRVEITTPSELSFSRNVASPVFTQQPSLGASNTLRIAAQTTTNPGSNGGRLDLAGGVGSGTGLAGGVRLSLQTQVPNDTAMVELAELAASRRVLSLVRLADITTTQMPANTGDGVIYVGNAQTNPSADAVTGHVYYSDGAKPAWRFNSINLRLDGTSATANAGGGAAVPGNVDRFLQIDIGGTTLKIPCFAA
jgi:hypothetical protein